MKARRWAAVMSVLLAGLWSGGCGNSDRWFGGGCGTLLGFEESHSSCPVAVSATFCVVFVVVGWPLSLKLRVVLVVGVLVGVVVDSWIVDASI
jgi:hypothetical protein